MSLPTRTRWTLLLALIGSLFLVWWAGRGDFIPQGPTAPEPGFGTSADWDLQWTSGEAARSAWANGELPWWDPFPDYGAPVLVHPETFVAHPVYALRAGAGVHEGLRALVLFSVLVLGVGCAWLAVELEAPWYLGLIGAGAVLASFEWENRLYTGHLMFLGVTAWPAGVASLCRALREASPTRWATLSGAIIGLASLGGAHYPTLFAFWVLGLVTWAAVTNRRWVAAWLGLAVLAVLLPGPSGLRWATSTLGALTLLSGFITSPERGRVGKVLGGAGLGLVAVAGWRLVPGLVLGQLVGRVRLSDVARKHEPVPLSQLLWFDGGLDQWLHLASPVLGIALMIGVVVGLRHDRLRAPAVAVLSLFLIACSAGRDASMWPLLHLGPGMTGVNYPLRLQWILLLIGPTLCSAVVWRATAWMHRREEITVLATISLLIVLLGNATLEDRTNGLRVESPPGPGVVTGFWIDRDTAPQIALAWYDGKIRVGLATAMGFSPPGAPPPLDGVEVERSTIRIRGPAGSTRILPQRHLPGWKCDGADPAPADPHRFLTVSMTGQEAICRYRSPGLLLGTVLQMLALAGLALVWRPRGNS